MKKLLIVVDMQNDFITGTLGTPEAKEILPAVKAKIEEYRNANDKIIYTRDTHNDGYLKTQEGKYLPVEHCLIGTEGHEIANELDVSEHEIFDKVSFGSIELAEHIAEISDDFDEIELCGLCTDICVVSNALIIKARLPEKKLIVDALCCAGVTPETHKAALTTMKMCQVNIINE